MFNSHHWQRFKPVELASKVFCGQTLLGRIGAGLYFPKSYRTSIKLGHMKPTYKLVASEKERRYIGKSNPTQTLKVKTGSNFQLFHIFPSTPYSPTKKYPPGHLGYFRYFSSAPPIYFVKYLCKREPSVYKRSAISV